MTTLSKSPLTSGGRGRNPRPDPQSQFQTCERKRAKGRKSSSYKDSGTRKEIARSYLIDL